jgi:hypothetical protein
MNKIISDEKVQRYVQMGSAMVQQLMVVIGYPLLITTPC